MASLFSDFIGTDRMGQRSLDLRVKGMHCASCASNVNRAIRQDGMQGSVDLASGRAVLSWQGEADKADQAAARIEALGFTVEPFAPATRAQADEAKGLLRCGLVAGVGMGISMLAGMMGGVPALGIAGLSLAVLAYAGRPFLASAARSLRGGHTNMDVPISFALVATAALGLYESLAHQATTSFDSLLMLVFILLIGRYLDARVRARSRAAAEDLLALFSGRATVIDGDKRRDIAIRDLRPDMILLVASGEKIAADGLVTQGESTVDPSLITGETIPQSVQVGTVVFGGMVNLGAALHVRVTASVTDGVVGEIVRLMDKARQAHARFVRLADRVAALYTPVVFTLSAATFGGWLLWGGADVGAALLIAASVLIITCPCAMGLAVPAVQVIASGRLFRRGLLLKTGDALEKLAHVDQIVFDKTGTLTLGRPRLKNRGDFTATDLQLAASLAASSKHPLARALCAAYGEGPLLSLPVQEIAGHGLQSQQNGRQIRLGRRDWCGVIEAPADSAPEMWLAVEGVAPIRMTFEDVLKTDAIDVVAQLARRGYGLHLYSGDRPQVVAAVAQTLGIADARGGLSPTDKHDALQALRAQGARVLMVGDGMNDAAALAAADVSLSPSSALDLAQNAADLVFQGDQLSPVIEALDVARQSERLSRQNIILSVIYNLLAVPLAMAGLAGPAIAAAAMSLSSLTVVLNAQRMRR